MSRASFLLVGILLFGAELPAQDTVEILCQQQEDFVPSPPATPWWERDAATGITTIPWCWGEA